MLLFSRGNNRTCQEMSIGIHDFETLLRLLHCALVFSEMIVNFGRPNFSYSYPLRRN